MTSISQKFRIRLRADDMMLSYPDEKALDNCVNLHYYREDLCAGNADARNLGDCLSPVIVEWMLDQSGLTGSRSGRKHLYAVGSIVFNGFQNATVWGSGLQFEPHDAKTIFHRHPFRKLDIRAVRGPKSRATLQRYGHSCPETYGDPAVLMPLIYKPKKLANSSGYCVIPHYRSKTPEFVSGEQVVSMATDDYASVIDRIASSEFVVSGSLHGIILAEAYGVPTAFYQDVDPAYNYKYEDWYLSTGRRLLVHASVEDAVDSCLSHLPDVPDLTDMQLRLVETFPYDIYADL